MRTALLAITDELKRLKADGVTTVSVQPATLEKLRSALHGLPRGEQVAEEPPVAVKAAPRIERTTSTQTPPPAKSAPVIAEPAAAPGAPKLPPPPQVVLPEGPKQTRWDALNKLVQSDPVCRAHVRPGKKIVLGVGSLEAKIFFCGEAPGAEEEEQGEPFVGPAGKLLTKMIQAMGLEREQVYIGNIMNWRPEMPLSSQGIQVGNRPPTAEELSYCLPYLRAQLEIVSPDLIVALGSTATQGLFGTGSFKTLGEIKGKWKQFQGKPVMVTYHPSYILRNPTNRSKRSIWEDLLKVMEQAGLPVSEKQRGYFLEK